MSKARFAATALATVSVASGILSAAGSAHGEPAARLSTSSPIIRGESWPVRASGLNPGASYALYADGAAFVSSGTETTEIVATDDGTATAMLTHTSSIPAHQVAVDFTLDDGAAQTVAEISVPVATPYLQANACPATDVQLDSAGLADGIYTLSSDHMTFTPTTVSATNGSFGSVTATADADLPATYTITATLQGDDQPSAIATARRNQPWLRPDTSKAPTLWWFHDLANCFKPGETVHVHPLDTDVTANDVIADQHGVAHITYIVHPSAHAHRISGMSVTGAQSGQTATINGGPHVYADTLFAGHSLTPRGDRRILTASRPGWLFANSCNPGTAYMNPDGSEATNEWRARPGRLSASNDCTLTLRRSGNLVLQSPTKGRLWSTHTAGTGTHNRLVIRDSGELVLLTARGRRVWSSAGP